MLQNTNKYGDRMVGQPLLENKKLLNLYSQLKKDEKNDKLHAEGDECIRHNQGNSDKTSRE